MAVAGTAHTYGRITIKNSTSLTTNVRYGLDDEVAFQNPQTSQNGLRAARKNNPNQTFRKAVIQLLNTSAATSIEIAINHDRDNLIIVQRGGTRTLELSDHVFIQGGDIVARGGAASGDIIIEFSN